MVRDGRVKSLSGNRLVHVRGAAEILPPSSLVDWRQNERHALANIGGDSTYVNGM